MQEKPPKLLLPCPFCGGEAHLNKSRFPSCGTMGCRINDIGFTKEQWNTRAEAEQKPFICDCCGRDLTDFRLCPNCMPKEQKNPSGLEVGMSERQEIQILNDFIIYYHACETAVEAQACIKNWAEKFSI